MPPGRTKKKIKKNHARPSLAFVESPTPSAIKFPNYAGSQQQTLEAPTVPFTEGGKWLSSQFSSVELKIQTKSKRPGRKAKQVTTDVPSGSRQWHTRRSKGSGSGITYAPLEITVTSKTSKKTKPCTSTGDDPDRQILRENVKSDVPVDNATFSDSSLNMPSAALAVTTPVFERGDLEALKSNYIGSGISCEARDSSGNLLKCGKEKPGNRRTMFESSDHYSDSEQEANVLVPDTPEREYGFSFHERWLKALKEKG